MRQDSEVLLEKAIHAIQTSQPDTTQMAAAAARVAGQLGVELTNNLELAAINSCADVQQSLEPYRAGRLSASRSTIIRAHLGDCGECHRAYVAGSGTTVLDWSAPARLRTKWKFGALRWVMVPAFTALLVAFLVYRAFWQVPPGVRAQVESVDGSAYLTSNAGDLPLAVGDRFNEGDHLRTSGGSHAVLRLSDGSSLEVNQRSVLAIGARGHDVTVAVDSGDVIIQAAKRTSGHLYVRTPDCRIAVTGTVFSVNAGIKGSRVAVLEGDVHVTHAGVDTLIHAGDQVSTNANLGSEPLEQQIAWSRDLDKYLPLLAQFSILQHRIEQIPSPQLRYSSDLLSRVPASTLLYVSIPNFGGFLNEANTIFHEQLKQSPALQQWWDTGSPHKTEELDALVDKLHQVSEYLGDEVVILSSQEPNSSRKNGGFAILADIKRAGLADLLQHQIAFSGPAGAMVVYDPTTLRAAPTGLQDQHGMYALVRQHEVVFANSVAMIRELNAQFDAGASGFSSGELGKQIAAAYSRGTGVILAADLQQMLHQVSGAAQQDQSRRRDLQASGIEDVRFLIAEHRESNGLPENHVDLQFAGTRHGVPSWLAAPAPIGSLEFVTPNASIAAAFLSKNPAAIAKDIINMAQPNNSAGESKWSEAQKKLQIDVQNDLAANLGGDFLLSLDGGVLPAPAWKAVLEVRNADQLEKTLERLADTMRTRNSGNENLHNVVIQSTQVGNQVFYTIRDLASGATLAQYTFADGYMILAPDRALLMQALNAHESGNSLAHSAAFKVLLPKDDNPNCSAIVYQNIGPVLTPLLPHLSGEAAQALTQLAADGRPTAICAWGNDTRIEAATNSRLFGFDLFALGALLHPANDAQHGNKQPLAAVE